MNKLTRIDILTFLLLISFVSIPLGIWYDYNHTQEQVKNNAHDMTSHTQSVIDSVDKSPSVVTKKFNEMGHAWIIDWLKTYFDGIKFARTYISGIIAFSFAILCFSHREEYKKSFLVSFVKFIFKLR